MSTTPHLDSPESDRRSIHGTEGPQAREVILTLMLTGLGLGLTINSVLGPLVADVIDYPVSDSMRNQTIGLDAAALFLLAPACMVVAISAWRGHQVAPVVAVSLGSYVAYIFVQYFAGPEFGYYPRTMLFHLGLFVGGWALAVYAWTLSRRRVVSDSPLSVRHAFAAFGLAGFVALRYVPGLVASLDQGTLPPEASGDVTMYWLIVLSDLGVFVPVALVTAVGILGAALWARLALVAVVTWFTIVSVAVGAMSLTMVINDDPFASKAQLGLFVVTTAVALGYAVHLNRTLVGADRDKPALEARPR